MGREREPRGTMGRASQVRSRRADPEMRRLDDVAR
jgi:hypothetical protein